MVVTRLGNPALISHLHPTSPGPAGDGGVYLVHSLDPLLLILIFNLLLILLLLLLLLLLLFLPNLFLLRHMLLLLLLLYSQGLLPPHPLAD